MILSCFSRSYQVIFIALWFWRKILFRTQDPFLFIIDRWCYFAPRPMIWVFITGLASLENNWNLAELCKSQKDLFQEKMKFRKLETCLKNLCWTGFPSQNRRS